MDCLESRVLLHGYIDGELDLRAALDLEGHLSACAACAGERRGHESLRAGLREARLAYRAPSSLKARLAASARVPVPAAVRLWPRWRPFGLAAGMAAGAFVCGLNLPRWRASFGEGGRATEVVDGHVRALKSGHLADVVSSDRHAVKPWFAGKLDYAPVVRDLSASGFPLVGGRLDVLGGKPVAALVYKRRGHIIDLYVLPAQAGASEGPRRWTIRGFHLERWAHAGMSSWAVSDLNEEELSRFASLLRE